MDSISVFFDKDILCKVKDSNFLDIEENNFYINTKTNIPVNQQKSLLTVFLVVKKYFLKDDTWTAKVIKKAFKCI